MAKKKKIKEEIVGSDERIQRFKGWQLLRLPQYKNRIAKLVIKEDSLYSFEEADKAIFDFKGKRG